MILIDTSVWIDHLRTSDQRVIQMLHDGVIATHPMVILELALGTLASRDTVLTALRALSSATVADDEEVDRLITSERLWGSGIGYVDAHLLAATRLTPGARLWTRDRRLRATADRLGLANVVDH